MSNEKTQIPSSVVCTNCGGQLEIDGEQDTIECPYCGTKYSASDLLNESDAVRAERIKAKANKEVESERIKHEAERLKHEVEKEKHEEEKSNIEKFKKSKFSKVLIVFAVLSVLLCAVSFQNGKILSGLLAVIMTALFILSYLMGVQIVKEKKKGLRILAALIAFLLFIPYFSLYSSNTSLGVTAEKFDWKDIALCEVLPEPDSNVGNIISNSEDSLSIYINKISKEDYKEYLAACEKLGFTIDNDKSESTYSAYNQEGYKLALMYFDINEEMTIELDAPMKMSEFTWPINELSKLLPAPKSNIGSISWENSDEFLIYVADTSIEDFASYVTECSNSGFNIDYSKGDDYYYAYNKDGNYVSLNYEGFNIIRIQMSVPDEESSSENTTKLTKSKASTTKKTSKDSAKKANNKEEDINSEPTTEFEWLSAIGHLYTGVELYMVTDDDESLYGVVTQYDTVSHQVQLYLKDADNYMWFPTRQKTLLFELKVRSDDPHLPS